MGLRSRPTFRYSIAIWNHPPLGTPWRGRKPGFTQNEYFIWSPLGLHNLMSYDGFGLYDGSNYIEVHYWPDIWSNGALLPHKPAAVLSLGGKYPLHASSGSGFYTAVVRRLPSNELSPSSVSSNNRCVSLVLFIPKPSPMIEVAISYCQTSGCRDQLNGYRLRSTRRLVWFT